MSVLSKKKGEKWYKFADFKILKFFGTFPVITKIQGNFPVIRANNFNYKTFVIFSHIFEQNRFTRSRVFTWTDVQKKKTP